ncbi:MULTISPECIES: ATP-binding protein [Thermoanaerobacter]|uniref:Anti-sigma regulatory factor (Ser/Thr protein kinase)/anti-anti-sigma regulatory factor n=1 Tax=Thermoanaerobacter pentosaceus TaxID=694059 RepID=A0ABT9M370_9THEO|nr:MULTISPECIES: ATP-binding protein [Thermoanaerobacter]MDP9750370.1 anti-sigma regulatory factor (Ser/Thr protein kinase)/anti-anti-sigma regulatory factor [Thermoanaerobacter pentosaceus]
MEIRFNGTLSIDNVNDFVSEEFFDNIHNEVIIDLSELEFIKPVGIAYVITLIKYSQYLRNSKGYKIIKPRNKNVHDYLARMGFYDLLNLSVPYPYFKHDSEGRFCEIRELETPEDVYNVSQQINEIIVRNIKGEYKLKNCISYSVAEVIENVFHHSKSPVNGFACAQVYPVERVVEIAVVDAGIGIKHSLSKKYKDLKTDIEAIEKALELYVTCKTDNTNSGEGLYFTKKFIEENKGELVILSGYGKYKLFGGQIEKKNISRYNKGTIVHMKFNLDTYVDVKKIFDSSIPLELDGLDVDMIF